MRKAASEIVNISSADVVVLWPFCGLCLAGWSGGEGGVEAWLRRRRPGWCRSAGMCGWWGSTRPPSTPVAPPTLQLTSPSPVPTSRASKTSPTSIDCRPGALSWFGPEMNSDVVDSPVFLSQVALPMKVAEGSGGPLRAVAFLCGDASAQVPLSIPVALSILAHFV